MSESVAKKRVLSVGQCGPDNAALRGLLTRHFEVEFETADRLPDALDTLHSERFDLVLINRKLDTDHSDGMEIIRQLKANDSLAVVPVMLVSNYAEHQQAAVAAGAEPGFGKLELERPETREKLARFLGTTTREE